MPHDPRLAADQRFVHYLVGRVRGDRVAVDLRSVREVRADLDHIAAPGPRAGMRGLKNVRGVVVPLIDVGAARDGGESTAGANSRLVVVRRLEDGGGYALWLDEVLGVRAIRARDVSRPHMREKGGAVAFLHFEDECIPVIDPLELVASARAA